MKKPKVLIYITFGKAEELVNWGLWREARQISVKIEYSGGMWYEIFILPSIYQIGEVLEL